MQHGLVTDRHRGASDSQAFGNVEEGQFLVDEGRQERQLVDVGAREAVVRELDGAVEERQDPKQPDPQRLHRSQSEQRRLHPGLCLRRHHLRAQRDLQVRLGDEFVIVVTQLDAVLVARPHHARRTETT